MPEAGPQGWLTSEVPAVLVALHATRVVHCASTYLFNPSREKKEKRKLSPRLRDPHESSSFSLGWNVPVRNAEKWLRRSLELNKMQKTPVVRRMRTGSAGSWPAAGPWLITGGEAAKTNYLSSRAETKCSSHETKQHVDYAIFEVFSARWCKVL